MSGHLGHNSLVRTSLPIKHSYLPHKRCRWDADLAISPYVFIRLACLADFFFIQQLYFPRNLLKSITPFFYVQFGEWNCQSKERFISSVSGLGGATSYRNNPGSQSAQKLYSSSWDRGSPTSWLGSGETAKKGGSSLLRRTHLCHKRATWRSKPCLTDPPLREMASALGRFSLHLPLQDLAITLAIRNKCTLWGDKDSLITIILLRLPWTLFQVGLTCGLPCSPLHDPV